MLPGKHVAILPDCLVEFWAEVIMAGIYGSCTQCMFVIYWI
jgi:hypothetical protein